MAEENPSGAPPVQVIMPRPVTGHRRVVQISHSKLGVYNLLTTEASWSDSSQPNYVNYAYTPPSGPKQRGLHSQGPTEINWRIGGELSNSTINLLALMDSTYRGTQFTSININQGPTESWLFSNPLGYFLPWSNFTLSGNQNGAVTFSLEGRSVSYPVATNKIANMPFPDVPLPSWYTGNDLVTAWSLSHNVNLTPNWLNNTNTLPAYYRPGHSEYTIQVTTVKNLVEYSLIKFGVGEVSLVEALVTSRNRTYGGRGMPVTYQATTTNAKVAPSLLGLQNAFTPSTVIEIPAGPTVAGFG